MNWHHIRFKYVRQIIVTQMEIMICTSTYTKMSLEGDVYLAGTDYLLWSQYFQTSQS